MPVEFELPDVGEGVAEGLLLEWYVEPGDTVEEDQVVAEVETDKAVVDVPSPVDGTVRELRAEPGETVPVGTVIITFDVEGEDESESEAEDADPSTDEATEADAQATDGRQGGRVFAAPTTRRLARELGVDLASVDGSGPGGRVTEGDVRAAAESAGDEPDEGDGTAEDDGTELRSAVSRIDDSGLKSAVTRIDDKGEGSGSESGAAGGASASADGTDDTDSAGPERAGRDRTLAAPATRDLARELGVDIDDVPATEERDGEAFVAESDVREYADAQERAHETTAADETGTETAETSERASREHREPYTGIRRTIGEAMERSKFTAPHVTHHDTVDVTALVEARERLKPRAEERDARLTYLPFVMKAVVAALREHPALNTTLDEEAGEIIYRDYYNLGVAVATDAGLMVPVVDDVDGKGLIELADEVTELAGKARDRSIAREEMQGGTFTITNFGAIGGEYATPIINHPETAILGLGAIKERPAVHEGEVVPRDVMTLSLSIDHRVVDGAEAAAFVNTLKEYLAEPTLLLLE